MTLTHIGLLAICVCAWWMLEGSACADPVTAPASSGLNPPPATNQDPASRESSLLDTDVASSSLMVDDWQTPYQSRFTEPVSGYGTGTGYSEAMSPYGVAPSPWGNPLSTQRINYRSWAQPAGEIGQFREQLGFRTPFTNFNPNWQPSGIGLREGPLALDLYAITFTSLYSDLHTKHLLNLDDGFLAAISLTGNLSLILGESFHLGVGFTVYYLPTVNRFGFYFGNGGADTQASLEYSTDVGRWHFNVSNRFGVYYPLSDILRDYEVDEIATAGRYRFGRPDLLASRGFYSEDIFFGNVARVAASTALTEMWDFTAYSGRRDVWRGESFEHADGRYVSGLTFGYHDWGRGLRGALDYMYLTGNEAHRILARVVANVTPTLDLDLRGGYIFYNPDGRSIERFLWEAGFVHHVNSELSHSLYGGYTFAPTDFGDDFIGSYVRYTVDYRPTASRARFAANIQDEHNDITGLEGVGWNLRTWYRLSDCSELNLFIGRIQYNSNASRLVGGAALIHRFTPTLVGQLSYQYSKFDGPGLNLDYYENLFSLTIIKGF